MSRSSRRSARLVLSDIIDAIDAVDEFIADAGEAAFVKDRKTISAVRYELLKISEAVRNLQRADAALPPDQPWNDIYNLGNRLRHDYIGIDDALIYRYVKEDLPSLRATVAQMLDAAGEE